VRVTSRNRLEAVIEQFKDKGSTGNVEKRHVLRLWREFISPVRWRLFLATVLTSFLHGESYLWGFVTMAYVDYVLTVGRPIPAVDLPHRYKLLALVTLFGLAVHTTMVICRWQSSYHITLVGQRVIFHLRRALHERLQALPLTFFDRIQTGRLLSIVIDDVATIQQSVSSIGVSLLTNIGSLILGLAIVFWINWRIALLAVAVMPFYVVNYRHFRPQIKTGAVTSRRATAALYARVEERIAAIRTVKVFGREHWEVGEFSMSVHDLARLMMYVVRLQNWQNTIATLLSALATGAVLYLGIRDYRMGNMTLGQVLFFYQTLGALFAPAVALSDIAVEVQRMKVVLRRIFDLLESEPEPVDLPGAVALSEAQGHIEFRDVTFAYPGDVHPSLRRVSFEVDAGKQVAVMGPSGSGKSTLLYLMTRFWDPTEGSILIDGHNLRNLKLLSLRDRITLVMQEPVIFSGTVSENIRYGRLDASDKDVRRAAKDSDLHEFVVTLPDGYETVVGERGMSLSGGQRQRLALAASLLSRPSVLLLDDTTSALDPSTEVKVRQTVNELMRGRTCFVVTHRVSAAMACDLVLVLEDGERTQFGPPESLLHEEGLFRRIYEQQTRESADDAAS